MKELNEILATLPELSGSEKQIAWALKLREKAIAELVDDATRKQAMIEKVSDSMRPRWERMLFTTMEMLNSLVSETSAAKIIDGWK